MKIVAEIIDTALMYKQDEPKSEEIKNQVREFSLKFPVPGIQ